MFPQKSNSFAGLTKSRKSGEQPNQAKRPLNPVFNKQRPLGEIQKTEFTLDFPEPTTELK